MKQQQSKKEGGMDQQKGMMNKSPDGVSGSKPVAKQGQMGQMGQQRPQMGQGRPQMGQQRGQMGQMGQTSQRGRGRGNQQQGMQGRPNLQDAYDGTLFKKQRV